MSWFFQPLDAGIIPKTGSDTLSVSISESTAVKNDILALYVGGWPLDETSGSALCTTSAILDMSEVGAPIASVIGKINRARVFDGTKYFTHGDNTQLSVDSNTAWTITGWAKIYSKASSMYALGKVTAALAGTTSEYYLRYDASIDRMVLASWDGTGTFKQIVCTNFGSPPLNTWFFFSLRFFPNFALVISINGSANEGVAQTTGPMGTSGSFSIGRAGDYAAEYWNGEIDEVHFWKRALQDNEELLPIMYRHGYGTAYPFVPPTEIYGTDTLTPSISDAAAFTIPRQEKATTDNLDLSVVDSPLAINKLIAADTLSVYIIEGATRRISKIKIVGAISSSGGGPTGGTAGFLNTLTANMILVSVSSVTGLNPTLTDNLGNTWISLVFTAGATVRCEVYAAFNPITGASHSFTVLGPSGCYAVVEVLAISGASTYLLEVPDQLVANLATSSISITTVDRTPSVNDELLVSALALSYSVSATASINQSYLVAGQLVASPGAYYGVALAYKYQFDAALTNPTWSWGLANNAATILLTLRPAPLAVSSPADTLVPRINEDVIAVIEGGLAHIVIDPFERTSMGANWATAAFFVNPLQLVDSEVAGTTIGSMSGMCWIAHPFTNDQYAELQIGIGADSVGLILRQHLTLDILYYCLATPSTGFVGIYRVLYGATTLLNSLSDTVYFTSGDRMKFSIVGDLLTLYQNDIEVLSYNDPGGIGTAPGQPGIVIYDTTATVSKWSAGSLGPMIFQKLAFDTLTLSIAETRSLVSSGFGVINMCGFETQSGVEVQAANAQLISTDVVRTGLAAGRVNPLVNGADYWMFSHHTPGGVRVSLNRYELTYYTFWVRFVQLPTGGADTESVFAAVTQNSGTSVICKLYISSTGAVRFEGTSSSGTIAILATGMWYRIDLRATTNGVCGVKIDGGGETTVTGGNFVQNVLSIGRDFATMATGFQDNTYDMLIDDVVICAGSFVPSGNGVRMLLPNAAGTTATWASGTGTTYNEVDDVPWDGDGTYIKTQSGSNKSHSFNMENAAAVGITGNILAVRLLTIGKTESGLASTALRLRSGSTNYDTPVASWVATYNPFARTYVADPNGEIPWTLAALDAIECGINAVQATTQHVSAVYALVWSDGVPLSTPIAASDTLDLSVAESTNLVVRLPAADALTLSIADDASRLITFYPLAATDTLDISLTETTSQFMKMPGVDSLTLSISDVASPFMTFRPLDLADTLALSITETASEFVTLGATDSLDLSLSDTAITSAKMTVTDTLDLSLTDAAVTSAKVPVADTLSLSMSEAFIAPAWITATDSLTVSIADTTVQSVTLATADALELSISDSAIAVIRYLPLAAADTLLLSIDETAVTSAKVPAADTLLLSIAETTSQFMQMPAADTLTLSIAETFTAPAWITTTDSLTVSISETTAQLLHLGVADALELSINDAAVTSAKVPVTDTLILSITETTSGLAWPSVSDTLGLSIAETTSLYLQLSLTDTLELSITETAGQLMHMVVTDSLDLSIAEGQLAIYKISGVGDTLTLGITESAEMVPSGLFPIDAADSQTISIAETAVVVDKRVAADSLTPSIVETTTSTAQVPAADSLVLDIDATTTQFRQMPVADTLEVRVDDTVITSAKVPVTDSLVLSITETPSQFMKLGVTDTLALSIADTRNIVSPVLRNDDLTISITETLTVVIRPTPEDTLALSVDETTAIFSRVLVSDTLAISISDAAVQELFVGVTGIPSAEAVGQPSITSKINVYPTTIPSEEVVPEPLIDAGSILIFVAGVPSAAAVGTPALEEMRRVEPVGISSEEGVGIPMLTSVVRPVGILSGESFGVAEIATSRPIRPVGIPSGEAFGFPFLVIPQFIYAASVQSAEMFGTTFVGSFVAIYPTSAGTGETFGDPFLLGRNRIFTWQIDSQEAFGTPRLYFPVQTLSPVGIASGEALGAPGLILYVLPAGIGSQEAFGTPQFAYVIRPEGIQSGEMVPWPLILSTTGESIFEPVLSDDLFSSVFT